MQSEKHADLSCSSSCRSYKFQSHQLISAAAAAAAAAAIVVVVVVVAAAATPQMHSGEYRLLTSCTCSSNCSSSNCSSSNSSNSSNSSSSSSKGECERLSPVQGIGQHKTCI